MELLLYWYYLLVLVLVLAVAVPERWWRRQVMVAPAQPAADRAERRWPLVDTLAA